MVFLDVVFVSMDVSPVLNGLNDNVFVGVMYGNIIFYVVFVGFGLEGSLSFNLYIRENWAEVFFLGDVSVFGILS